MSQYANFVCDLHGHTNRSDGYDSPLEFLHHAVERRMKIVAITDHDKVPPESVTVDGQEWEITSYARSLGMQLIRGTEISCETDIEDVHLVCFGCDWEADFFRQLDQFVAQSKIKSYQELIRRLNARGFEISWEEVRNRQGKIIDESEVQKKMIFNRMAEKGYTKDWSEAKLLVKKDPELSVSREKPKAVDVIHEVHRQGGIVILAHPYLISEQIVYEGRERSRSELIEKLIYEGLDGIEGRYTYDKTSYAGTLSKEEIFWQIVHRYRDKVPVISGGSDYHGDRRKGMAEPREIGECGLTESEFYSNPVLTRLL